MSRLKEKMEAAKAHVQKLREIGDQLQKIPDKQISSTDPDARSMATSGRGTGIVGYNVQTAVETEHHLIVAHEVTNVGHDHHLLHKMATAAREALGTKGLTTIADRGYFKGEEILACEEQGIATLVPKPQTSSNRATGLFDKRDFRYMPETDEYACPAGQRAIWRFSCVEDGQTIHKYWSSACVRCSIKSRCTTGVYRRISRWEHEAVLERMQQQLDRTPDAMPIRRRTVEHPFGTLKAWMGATHFLTKTLSRVSTEMSLHVMAIASPQNLRIMPSETTLRFIVYRSDIAFSHNLDPIRTLKVGLSFPGSSHSSASPPPGAPTYGGRRTFPATRPCCLMVSLRARGASLATRRNRRRRSDDARFLRRPSG